MRLDAHHIREIALLKYYRLVRRWACKTYNLKDADLELLVYLDCKGLFTRNDFINVVYTYSWDKNRWERLRRDGWIDVFKERNRTTSKYAAYKVSYKANRLITRMYKILLGEEDIPSATTSVFHNNKTYTDKVFNKAIDDMINDKQR